MIQSLRSRRQLSLLSWTRLSRWGNTRQWSTVVDVRSDTVTLPSKAMLQAATSAPLGDDVMGEDPTVLELEHYMADLFGKERGLFLPTGTMANLVAIMAHCNKRASEVRHVVVVVLLCCLLFSSWRKTQLWHLCVYLSLSLSLSHTNVLTEFCLCVCCLHVCTDDCGCFFSYMFVGRRERGGFGWCECAAGSRGRSRCHHAG